MQFAHEKLSIYQKALEFFAHAQAHIASWSKQHAFVDHLLRASESILFNLAEAVRLVQSKKKALCLDYAIGSVFECAACLDLRGPTRQPGHPIVNLAENYLGFNCAVVFAENYLEAAPASEPVAPISLHPAS